MNAQHKSPALNPNLCQELEALLPAYSLGTATPEEVRLVQALLPFCPDADTILADYDRIANNLVALYPMTAEPPSSAALLNRLHAPPSPVASKPPRAAAAPPPKPVRRLWLWGALAACLILAFVGSNLYWAAQLDALRRDQQAFFQTIANTQSQTVSVVNAQSHHRLLQPAEAVARNSQASFVWNSADQIGALVVNGLPTLKPGETYQLWLVRDERSLSLGTFQVDEQGTGFLIFHAAQPVENFSHIGVSVEPEGGTSIPTTPHLIIGSI